MKRIVLLLVLIQQVSIAQIENSVFPKVPYTEFNALAVEGSHIYTAGDCNTALVSDNGGQNWNTVALDETIQNIQILPGSNGQKAIYQSRDKILVFDMATAQFEEISSASLFLSSGNFVSVEVDDKNIYIISNQNIHMSSASNIQWTKVADFNFDNDAVELTDITENIIHIATLDGLYLRVRLDTYEIEMRNEFMNRIYAFDMVTDNLGYFTVQNFTYAVKTTDGGTTYTELENMPENVGVTGYGQDIILTINTNRMYLSLDGGASSTYIPIPDDGTYDLINAKYMTKDGILYVAGKSAMVAKTEDFGITFTNLNTYKRENLSDIHMHTSGVGVAAGGFSTVIKTTDGGDTWTLIPWDNSSNDYLNAVLVVNEEWYLVAGSNTLYVFENDEIISTVERGIEVMHHNEAEGYIIGLQSSNSDYAIVKSTDNGLSWESKAFVPGYNYSIHQAPGGKIYVPGLEGNIYTSIDGGETWEIESFGDDLPIRRMDFLDENVGIASTGLKLYLTTDGGVSADLLVSGYDIRNLNFLSTDHILYTTSNEAQTNIYESTDGGQIFAVTKEFCSETNKSFTDVNGVIWLAQNGGHINKYKPETSTSTVETSMNTLSIFPNPVRSGQPLNLDLNLKLRQVHLITMDGRKLNIELNSDHSLSTSGLVSGIYTVEVELSDQSTIYARFIITK